MNILKTLRNPKLPIYASLFMLFFSCSQYEIRNRAFDYAIFDTYKNNPLFDKIYEKVKADNFKLKANSNLELKKEILKIVNSEVGSELNLSDEILKLSDYDGEEVLEVARNKGWISENDKTLITTFNYDYENNGFDIAIGNFENSVLNMNLAEEEFLQKQNFANAVKLVNSEVNNSEIINLNGRVSFSAKSWGCFFAIVGWLVSIVGLIACATIILCTVALVGYAIAVRNLYNECLAN
ncbi:hypothetical protein [Polaribacter sp.]|uniref:hypothetical protein n=1 Tax=Polaribacter sp. TaxID=1920175 RepID=UPI003F695D17